jgi:methylenetetrahydrofolate dehydrogenase (NADP+)/methenyltetrahydrofolate cyclohydrolase
MAKLINGKEIADELIESLKRKVDKAKEKGVYPKIALINASSDPASEVYIAKKIRMAEQCGIESEIYKFDDGVEDDEIADLIMNLNDDVDVHAILLQSPLANGLEFRKLVDFIDPRKDVDGLTTINQGLLFVGEKCIAPCTPLGVLHLICEIHSDIAGMHAVVIGRSSIVGKPLSQLLLSANCSVTTLHSGSRNVPEICRQADILVSAVGKPRFVKKDFVKPGATVIDVGISRIRDENGVNKIVGDVDFDNVKEIAGAITPVPNGVGPMTVAYLMHNTLKLAYEEEIS